MARALTSKPIINKDLAENAKQMVEFGFWKYLQRFMDEIYKECLDHEDSIPQNKLTPGDIGFSRGVRHTIKRIKDEVDQYTI